MKVLLLFALISIAVSNMYADNQGMAGTPGMPTMPLSHKIEKISLRVGEEWSREFISTPGAGYRWELRVTDPQNREIVKLAAQEPKIGERVMMGGPKTERWVFKAIQPGHTKLFVEYVGPTGQVAEILILDFTVTK